MTTRKRTRHPKASKAVLGRQTTSLRLLADLEQQCGQALGVAGAATMLQGLAPWLEGSLEKLVALDEEVFAHRARLSDARHQRDTALRQLASDVAHLRLSIESQYKAPQVQRLGFETPTPRSPEPLLRVASRVAKNLARPELDDLLGQPWYKSPFDPATQKTHLARQVEELRQLLHQVDTLGRDLDLARIRRGQAQQDHDILVREARQALQSIERLARLGERQARHQPQTTPQHSAKPTRATEVARCNGMSLAEHTPTQPSLPRGHVGWIDRALGRSSSE